MADNSKLTPRELAKKGQELAKKKSLERYKKFLTSQTARREAGEVSAEDSAKQSRAFWHKENPRFARRRDLKRAEDDYAMFEAQLYELRPPTSASELTRELTKSPRAVARKTEGLNRADDARHGAFRMAPNPSRASILTKARRNKK